LTKFPLLTRKYTHNGKVGFVALTICIQGCSW